MASKQAKIKPATLEDYQVLVSACVKALVSGHKDLYISFFKYIRFSKDFPKGVLHERTDTGEIRKIKVSKLLDWLNTKGYTDITAEHIRVQQIQFTMFEKEI